MKTAASCIILLLSSVSQHAVLCSSTSEGQTFQFSFSTTPPLHPPAARGPGYKKNHRGTPDFSKNQVLIMTVENLKIHLSGWSLDDQWMEFG